MSEIPADLVISGRIASLGDDHGLGWVESIAVRAGRIVASGSVADLESLVGFDTTRWQLAGDVAVMPTITDAHLHLASAALAADQPDLRGLDRRATEQAIATAHRDRLESGDDDGWLLGHGWSFDDLGEHPDASWLDDAAPGRPVALWSHDHHSRWLSARAIQRAGLAAASDPPSGRIERDAEGRPTGIMYEHAAGLVDAAIPAASLGEVDWAIGSYARSLAELGVTSVHDPGPLAPDAELTGGPVHYRALAEGGHLPLRVIASVREEQLERAIGLEFRSGRPFDAAGDGRYRDGWLKLFSDGALGSRTAALLAPYEADDPAGPPPGGAKGMALRSHEQLVELTTQAALAGIASQVHALGDAAVRTALDVLAELPPAGAFRHRVEHAQLIDPADVTRFGQLNVAASVQPSHLISDSEPMARAWGTRSEHAFPLAALDEGGACLPFGTDAPVESPDPWPGLAVAVSRSVRGHPHAPAQALMLERALRALCLDGPQSAGVADEGHLGIGARADLLVVPGAIFEETIEPDRLAATRPLATVLDGQLIYQAPGFDP